MPTVPRWKMFELDCAKDVGTRRIPVTGIDRNGADFIQGMFCYQAKFRKVLPAFLFDWMAGICGVAATTNQIGVLVLNRPRTPRKEALVIVRWSDWVQLHGEPPEAGNASAATNENLGLNKER